MGLIRIACRARDEAGNVVVGSGYQITAYQAGTTTPVTTYLDAAGAITNAQPGRPSTATSTTIAASAASGQQMIQVSSTSGFVVGDSIHVVGGGNAEEHLIQALLTSPTRIQTALNLANTFATGSVGGAQDKGGWARYVPDSTNTDVAIVRVSDGKLYMRVTFPTARVRTTQAPAFAASLTVDSSAGDVVFVGTLTAAITINAPTNPVTGRELSFSFLQNGTGGWTVTWDAAFKVTWSDTGNTLNKRASVRFIYNGANWIQIGAQQAWG